MRTACWRRGLRRDSAFSVIKGNGGAQAFRIAISMRVLEKHGGLTDHARLHCCPLVRRGPRATKGRRMNWPACMSAKRFEGCFLQTGRNTRLCVAPMRHVLLRYTHDHALRNGCSFTERPKRSSRVQNSLPIGSLLRWYNGLESGEPFLGLLLRLRIRQTGMRLRELR